MKQKKIILTILFLTLLGCISEKKDNISKDSYLEYDIIKLQTAMQNNELTSRKLVDYYLQRIALLDHSGLELRSIIEINPDAKKIAEESCNKLLANPNTETYVYEIEDN